MYGFGIYRGLGGGSEQDAMSRRGVLGDGEGGKRCGGVGDRGRWRFE